MRLCYWFKESQVVMQCNCATELNHTDVPEKIRCRRDANPLACSLPVDRRHVTRLGNQRQRSVWPALPGCSARGALQQGSVSSLALIHSACWVGSLVRRFCFISASSISEIRDYLPVTQFHLKLRNATIQKNVSMKFMSRQV
jgi:hypothetical protein